jgi:hypothetical protein
MKDSMAKARSILACHLPNLKKSLEKNNKIIYNNIYFNCVSYYEDSLSDIQSLRHNSFINQEQCYINIT